MLLGINWKVRLLSKQFWLLVIPAILLIVQIVANMLGFKLELDAIQAMILDLVNAIFALLLILGVAVDVTTPGIKDSPLTLDKTEPSSFTTKEAAEYLIDTRKTK